MRSLIITQNVTIDGSIEMLEPEPDASPWFDPAVIDDELTAEMQRQDATADALLVGRRTFEDLRSFWKGRHDDTTGTAEYLNAVAKYVVSATLEKPGWANTIVLQGNLLDAVAALRNRPGRDIVCTGSITLCHSLIAAGLVDEYRLFTYPFVQGRGRRLFPQGCFLPGLTPSSTPKVFPSGVTLMCWRQVR
ncbi:dihydrofolate reductase family protein [Mycobacterium sp. SMC-4]|uniref:dihydrofolate reductase family protein n=1 Tax=Mycobacterium sp. SMC-4 TaxID=2857059 RepID=UPI0021B37B08|nr:dihydrofolate reductase family protein [Mycobacterium sp. SMC-4]UXA20304.1 dihydrofolate reductase family protein [Mycobacterium sp. SMC-4]